MAKKPSGPRMRMPRRRTRSTATPPARPQLDVEDLRDALELACLDAMGGDAPGPYLAKTLERTCREVLRGRGLGGGLVEVSSTRQRTAIRITLPPDKARVRESVISVG